MVVTYLSVRWFVGTDESNVEVDIRRFTGASSAMTAAGPVLFGVAFLAPLIAQSLEAMSMSAPLGLEPIHFGLGMGLLLGSIAAFRGRWV